LLPWIPEPSVNNKLKRREGSGSTGGTDYGTDSVLKPLILFCDWRGLINLLFTEGSGIQGSALPNHG
jgi:hypothetical protein